MLMILIGILTQYMNTLKINKLTSELAIANLISNHLGLRFTFFALTNQVFFKVLPLILVFLTILHGIILADMDLKKLFLLHIHHLPLTPIPIVVVP